MGSNSSKPNSEEKQKTTSKPACVIHHELPDLNESFHGDAPKPDIAPENLTNTMKKQLSDHPKSIRKISNPSTPNSISSRKLVVAPPNEEIVKPISFRHTISIPISEPIPVPVTKPTSNKDSTKSYIF